MASILPTAGLPAGAFSVLKYIATGEEVPQNNMAQDWADWLVFGDLASFSEQTGWRLLPDGEALWTKYTSAKQAEYARFHNYA